MDKTITLDTLPATILQVRLKASISNSPYDPDDPTGFIVLAGTKGWLEWAWSGPDADCGDEPPAELDGATLEVASGPLAVVYFDAALVWLPPSEAAKGADGLPTNLQPSQRGWRVVDVPLDLLEAV